MGLDVLRSTHFDSDCLGDPPKPILIWVVVVCNDLSLMRALFGTREATNTMETFGFVIMVRVG